MIVIRTLVIGKLNKRLSFYKLADIQDSLGQTTKELQLIKTVWGTLQPLRGAEYYEVQKVQSKVTHKCYIRYTEGIDTNCFLKYKDRTFSIESVIDVDFECKLLEISCVDYVNKEVMDIG